MIALLGTIPGLGDFKAQTETNGNFLLFQNASVNDGLEMLIFTLGGLQKFTEENVLCVGERQGRYKDMSSLCPEKFRFMPFMNIAFTLTISLLLNLINLPTMVKRAPLYSCEQKPILCTNLHLCLKHL